MPSSSVLAITCTIAAQRIENVNKPSSTKEPQYNALLEVKAEHGVTQLGLMTNQGWHDDPKRLAFTLARYKFVAKMLAGRKNVLEIGCADAFATRIVQQAVGKVTATDFDPIFIDDVNSRFNPRWPLETLVHDMLSGPIDRKFDAAYALDVLEHIDAEREDDFLRNVVEVACGNRHCHIRHALLGVADLCVCAKQGRPRELQIGRRVEALARTPFSHRVRVFDER